MAADALAPDRLVADVELDAYADFWFEMLAKDELYSLELTDDAPPSFPEQQPELPGTGELWRRDPGIASRRLHIVPLTFVVGRPRVRARAPRPIRRRVRRTLARGRGRPREPEPALAGGAR